MTHEVFTKALATIENSDDEDFGPNGGFRAILSTPSLDRDGDKLHRDEWVEPLQDRYPLDMDHGMTVEDTIGSFEPYFDGDDMWMRAYFASTEKAQMVRTLIDEGHIRSVSVAFMTDKSKKDGEPRRELLNAGVVAIPSNRDAIIQCSKSARAAVLVDSGVMTPEEAKAALLLTDEEKAVGSKTPQTVGVVLNVVPKIDEKAIEELAGVLKAAGTTVGGGGDSGALTQAIHDAAVHLGATCIQMVTDEDSTGADDGANKSVTVKKSFEDNTVTLIYGDRTKTFTEEELHAGAASTWLKSLIEEVATDTKSQTLALEVPDGIDLEQFKAALTEVLTPRQDESPAESPAEAAAASEEEPAPADDAADNAADEPAVDPDKQANEMLLNLFAAQNL